MKNMDSRITEPILVHASRKPKNGTLHVTKRVYGTLAKDRNVLDAQQNHTIRTDVTKKTLKQQSKTIKSTRNSIKSKCETEHGKAGYYFVMKTTASYKSKLLPNQLRDQMHKLTSRQFVPRR